MTYATHHPILDTAADRARAVAGLVFKVSFWALVIALPLGAVLRWMPPDADVFHWGLLAGAAWAAAPVLMFVVAIAAVIGAALVAAVAYVAMHAGYAARRSLA